MNPSRQLSAVLYARVSVDRDGKSQSVDQQLAALRVVAEREGWSVRAEIRDDGISASSFTTRARPGYARLTEVLRSGDVLAVWELSRATRQMSEWVVLRDLCASRGVLLYDGTRLIDLTDATDAYTSAIGMATSEYESQRIAARIRRSTDARAQTGKPYGDLGFGWVSTFDPVTGERVWSLHPTEAPAIAEAVAALLAGLTTTTAIQRQWAAQGIVGRRQGTPMPPTQVVRTLRRASNAGLRVHRGETMPVRGTWPAIISEADHHRLLHILANPARHTSPGTDSTTLLSAIARCGECGKPVRRETRKRKMGSIIRYRCREAHVVVKAAPVDTEVTTFCLNLIASEQIAAWLAQDHETDSDAAEHLARAAELETRLTDAADAYARGELPVSTLSTITATLTAQIAQERAAAAAGTDDAQVRALLSAGTVETWLGWDLDARRQFVRALLTVTLHRGGGVTIEPRRSSA